MLDWSDFEVLAPNEHVFLPGPVDRTTWGFARNTASNPLRIAHARAGGPQYEKFLFYRGLGDLAFPVRVTLAGNSATASNTDVDASMGGLFLMQVTGDSAGFAELGDLASGANVSSPIPAATMSHGEFVPALKTALARRLVGAGLYTDEAKAMVDTWERSYFLTPGVRLLYLLPQAITDRTIPLTIAPAPAKLARTMVIRMELVTPEQERRLSASLAALGSGSTEKNAEARRSLLALGRFAQPHLTRAIALSSSPTEKAAGERLLVEIQKKQRWAPTAAE